MPDSISQLDTPPEVVTSQLFARGGFVVIPSLLTEIALNALTTEANSIRPTALRNVHTISDGTEGRGGAPARAFTSAQGSDVQWRIFSAPEVTSELVEICGIPVTPTGGGSYTFYEQPGDFLALHRDIDMCDLAVITCLAESGPASASGGLLVYPEYIGEPLTRARIAGPSAATPVPLRRGETVALLGGIVPHEVAPMQPGQDRIVSVMCFQLAVNDKRI